MRAPCCCCCSDARCSTRQPLHDVMNWPPRRVVLVLRARQCVRASMCSPNPRRTRTHGLGAIGVPGVRSCARPPPRSRAPSLALSQPCLLPRPIGNHGGVQLGWILGMLTLFAVGCAVWRFEDELDDAVATVAAGDAETDAMDEEPLGAAGA